VRNFKLKHILLLTLFYGSLNAQIIISKPNLGFTQACASSSFNSFEVTFSFSPETNLNPSNQFILELSDAFGSFSNPEIVYTSIAGSITTSPVTLTFSIPTNTSGEEYKIRVKSTAPVATSSASNIFAAYYKIQDSPFSINNLVETAVFCSGASYLLTIDNPGNIDNDSPLQYPSLTFNWFRETGSTTSVFVASGESLEVDSVGTYFAETNYGSCTSNSFSNRVTISEATSENTTTSINSSLGNPFCSDNGPTTLSTISGEAYQWFKDGVEIEGATNQIYQTSENGEFSVNVDLGICSASATILLENTGFESSINIEETSLLQNGENIFVTITTSVSNLEFRWYRNDELIVGETTNTYEVREPGNYRAEANLLSGCTAIKVFNFTVREPFPDVPKIPNVITPNGDDINDNWIIPQQYVSGTNTEVIIYNSKGKLIFQTTDYQNNWPENQQSFKVITPIYYYVIKPQNQEPRKGSITVLKQ